MNKNIFSKRLKELRENKNMTKTELASIVGCDQPKISKLENPENATLPSVDNLIEIAKHFGVSIDYLLGAEKKEQNKLKTFADVIQMLFDIDEATYISINPHDKEYMEARYNGYPEFYTKKTYQLNFEEHGILGFYLDDFMKSWKETKDYLEKNNGDIGKKMYELWKKDQLERSSQKMLDESFYIPDGIDEVLPFD